MFCDHVHKELEFIETSADGITVQNRESKLHKNKTHTVTTALKGGYELTAGKKMARSEWWPCMNIKCRWFLREELVRPHNQCGGAMLFTKIPIIYLKNKIQT